MADITVTAAQVRVVGEGYDSFPCNAGEALSFGDLVRIDSDGEAVKADTDTAAGVTATLGLVIGGASGNHRTTGAVASGERCAVLLRGFVFLGESAALDETKILFASGTAGKMADVAPVNPRVVATPISTTTVYFNPPITAPGS